MALRDFEKDEAVKATGIDLEKIHEALEKLASVEVLVGVPESEAARQDEANITNAGIGYLAEFGSPANNLPERPWLIPTIREHKVALSGMMVRIANQVMAGRLSAEGAHKAMDAVGITAVSHIKKKIQAGLQPPLSPVTLMRRAARGDEGAAWEISWRAAGVTMLDGLLAKPYIDTGNFLASIKHVVVKR